MKKTSLFTLSLFFSLVTWAQAYTAQVEYQKVQRLAVLVDMPFKEKTTREAIEEKLKQKGYKGKEQKGYLVYKGVIDEKLGTQAVDLYIMVDKRSKRDNDNSIVTVLVSKGMDAFVTEADDAALIERVKAYLVGYKAVVDAYDLELRIKEQEDAVKDGEKKNSKLIDKGQDLEKDKKNIEKRIEENKTELSNQKIELEKQRQILEKLKLSRKLN